MRIGDMIDITVVYGETNMDISGSLGLETYWSGVERINYKYNRF
jgi:hypothetical protein